MADLLQAMRYCAAVKDGSKCVDCAYDKETGGKCVEGLLTAAADEIERLRKEYDELDAAHDLLFRDFCAEKKRYKTTSIGWVSVKKALPSLHKPTHIVYSGSREENLPGVEVIVLVKGGPDGRYWATADTYVQDMGFEEYGDSVAYWMYLPEALEEEKEG